MKSFFKRRLSKTKAFLDIHWKTMIENVLETLDISWRIILILSLKDIDNNAYIQKELENFKTLRWIDSYLLWSIIWL